MTNKTEKPWIPSVGSIVLLSEEALTRYSRIRPGEQFEVLELHEGKARCGRVDKPSANPRTFEVSELVEADAARFDNSPPRYLDTFVFKWSAMADEPPPVTAAGIVFLVWCVRPEDGRYTPHTIAAMWDGACWLDQGERPLPIPDGGWRKSDLQITHWTPALMTRPAL